MPISTVITLDLADFNANFEAKVQWFKDNISWDSELEAADIARFSTALALQNYNVRIVDDNGDIVKIQNP